ncbi:MAG: response regulator [Jatrophihabitans sp.]|uniref:response regulator n=1 Tax=Jatrophihabitans sp. TaxID=1932789 RepID=UPI003F7E5F0E
MSVPPPPAVDPVRIFLVDDHEIVRRGLADMLSTVDDFEVVGEAGTVADALARVLATRPDVAILDVHLPDGSGVDLCRDIRAALPATRCLVFTSFDDEGATFASVLAGASGYVLKDLVSFDVIDSVRQVARGRSLISPELLARVMTRLQAGNPDQDTLDALTEREREVLDLMAEGLTNKEIGQRLFLSDKTIKNYVSSVLAKLGMERRSQAAVYAAILHEHG